MPIRQKNKNRTVEAERCLFDTLSSKSAHGVNSKRKISCCQSTPLLVFLVCQSREIETFCSIRVLLEFYVRVQTVSEVQTLNQQKVYEHTQSVEVCVKIDPYNYPGG